MILSARLHVVPAASPSPASNLLAGRSSEATLPPFHSWGLIFGIRDEESNGAAAEVGRTNLPSDTTAWAIDGLPWGAATESAYRLSRLVLRFLRPDWQASFWSLEYFEQVAQDFAHQFLVPAPLSGGQVSRDQINAWLESLGLFVIPLPSSVHLVAGMG